MQVQYISIFGKVLFSKLSFFLSKHTVKCQLNAHWKPFYRSHCQYCSIYYQVIGKLETWSQDMENAVKVHKRRTFEKFDTF